jgi:hypothetical protein
MVWTAASVPVRSTHALLLADAASSISNRSRSPPPGSWSRLFELAIVGDVLVVFLNAIHPPAASIRGEGPAFREPVICGVGAVAESVMPAFSSGYGVG